MKRIATLAALLFPLGFTLACSGLGGGPDLGPLPANGYLDNHGAFTLVSSSGKKSDGLPMRLPGGQKDGSLDGMSVERITATYPMDKIPGKSREFCIRGPALDKAAEALLKKDGWRVLKRRGNPPDKVVWTLGHKERSGEGEVARLTLEPALTCTVQVIFF